MDKQVGLLSSKGPLEYQAVQLMNQQNLEVVAEDYATSDSNELRIMTERGTSDVYGNDFQLDEGQNFVITDQENFGAGAPYIA